MVKKERKRRFQMNEKGDEQTLGFRQKTFDLKFNLYRQIFTNKEHVVHVKWKKELFMLFLSTEYNF